MNPLAYTPVTGLAAQTSVVADMIMLNGCTCVQSAHLSHLTRMTLRAEGRRCRYIGWNLVNEQKALRFVSFLCFEPEPERVRVGFERFVHYKAEMR